MPTKPAKYVNAFLARILFIKKAEWGERRGGLPGGSANERFWLRLLPMKKAQAGSDRLRLSQWGSHCATITFNHNGFLSTHGCSMTVRCVVCIVVNVSSSMQQSLYFVAGEHSVILKLWCCTTRVSKQREPPDSSIQWIMGRGVCVFCFPHNKIMK